MFHGEKKQQKFEATLRVRSKTKRTSDIARLSRNVRDVQERAQPKGYEYQGIEHFVKKCPAWQKRRGRIKNSPGKENPSARTKSQGIRLNPGQ
jgi:hypothetical protein